ncbi:hypothetical protein [Flavobacterium sp.]
MDKKIGFLLALAASILSIATDLEKKEIKKLRAISEITRTR